MAGIHPFQLSSVQFVVATPPEVMSAWLHHGIDFSRCGFAHSAALQKLQPMWYNVPH
jgi:hypothetical protein